MAAAAVVVVVGALVLEMKGGEGGGRDSETVEGRVWEGWRWGE